MVWSTFGAAEAAGAGAGERAEALAAGPGEEDGGDDHADEE